jgi:hypothetical protein
MVGFGGPLRKLDRHLNWPTRPGLRSIAVGSQSSKEEPVAPEHPILVEVRLQLLDALDRLESAERHFQETLPRKLVCGRTAQFTRECRIQSPAGIHESIS